MPNYSSRLPKSACEAAKSAALSAARAWEERAARANRPVFEEVMNRIGREAPRDGDELPPSGA